jgi:hypothetical protein
MTGRVRDSADRLAGPARPRPRRRESGRPSCDSPGKGTTDPKTFSFGRSNLVTDAFGRDLPLELGNPQFATLLGGLVIAAIAFQTRATLQENALEAERSLAPCIHSPPKGHRYESMTQNRFDLVNHLIFSECRHQFAAWGVATEYGFDSIVAEDSLRYRSRRSAIGHQS